MSIATVSAYLKAHERLVIVIILASLCWFAYGKYQQIRLDHDNSVLAQQKLVTDAAQTAAKAQAAQSAQDAASLQVLQTRLENQNAQLVLANTSLATALATHQRTDASLPLPDLALRWTTLVPAAHPTATQSGLNVDPDSAHATVAALEQVPVLQTELANETTLKANDDQVITQQTKSIFDLNTQVAGLNTLQADKDKQCTDQIKVVKAQAAKSKRRWFKIGFVAGFLTRQIIKTETGW